jgi:hypothetical protein
MSKAIPKNSRKEQSLTLFLLPHQKKLKEKSSKKNLRSRNDINI